jgi:hypothetical protein
MCRWLTVLASDSEVQVIDLPPQVRGSASGSTGGDTDWKSVLSAWATLCHRSGEGGVAEQATARFKWILIYAALTHCGGRPQDAAKRLGWGRNTLARKVRHVRTCGACHRLVRTICLSRPHCGCTHSGRRACRTLAANLSRYLTVQAPGGRKSDAMVRRSASL